MTAEGNETPKGEPPRSTDRDLLAERRARRAVDLEPAHTTPAHPTPAQPTSTDPTDALTRRAEAAEATVQTLETHLASLQQRVRETAEERVLLSERLDSEQAAVAEREQELRRVKQREYAEQQLRVEAEDRHLQLERDSRAEIDRLTRRLGASEHHARELGERLESVQRELDEAEQATAAELTGLRSVTVGRAERELRVRLAELERRAHEIRREVDAERVARERAEQLLEGMREGYRRVERLVAELKGVAAQLRAGAAGQPSAGQHAPGAPGDQREELADALATAVERLRARAELAQGPSEQPTVTAPIGATAVVDGAGSAPPSPHKHSMSLLTRIRRRRKQRRERRSAAAEPPTMQSQ